MLKIRKTQFFLNVLITMKKNQSKLNIAKK